MKKLLLSVSLVLFGIVAQAGDAKTCQDGDMGGCCMKSAKTSANASCCPMGAKTAAKASAKQNSFKVVLSPKAASLLKG